MSIATAARASSCSTDRFESIAGAPLRHESADEYHAKAKAFLSSHALADFRKCPLLFHLKQQGLIADENRPAYLIGRAFHTLTLEGRQKFETEYAFGGPINDKTGQPFGATTKAFAEWAAQQGKPVLTFEQLSLIEAMAASVRDHAFASQLFNFGSPEGVVRATYCEVPCQIRMDWFDPHQALVDLKSCDDLTWFEADARRFGYVHQLAFYRAVLAQVIGVLMPVFLVAVEKKAPFRCGVWRVTENALFVAQGENEAAIGRLRRCRESNDWPTGYETCREFDYL